MNIETIRDGELRVIHYGHEQEAPLDDVGMLLETAKAELINRGMRLALTSIKKLTEARRDAQALQRDQIERKIDQTLNRRDMLDLEACGGRVAAYTAVIQDIERLERVASDD